MIETALSGLGALQEPLAGGLPLLRARMAARAADHAARAGSLLDEWDALATRVDAAPFVRRGWIAAWADAFGGGADRLRIVPVRRDGTLVAAVPLLAGRGRLLASPTNWHSPGFGVVAADAAAQQAAWTKVFACRAHAVDVRFVDDHDTVLAVAAAHAAGRQVRERPLAEQASIALSGSFAAYEAALSRNRRKALRGHWRRLEAAGQVTVEVDTTTARLHEFYEVEASGWKGRAGTAIASTSPTLRFYDRIAAWAAAEGWLRVSTLRLDGEAIAADLSIVHGGRWYSLKAGYREEHRRLGPGVLLLHRLVERGHAEGLERLELLGTTDALKAEWATHARTVSHVAAFRPTARGAAGATVAGSLRLARRIRRGSR